MNTETLLKDVAARAFKANLNRDNGLYAHLLRPYPFGTPERRTIEAEMSKLAAERRAANPPHYFC